MPARFIDFYIQNEDLDNLLNQLVDEREYIDTIEYLFELVIDQKEEIKNLKEVENERKFIGSKYKASRR